MRRGAGMACTIAGWIMLCAFLFSLIALIPALVVMSLRSSNATAMLFGVLVPPVLLAGSLALIQSGRMLANPAMREGHCRACDYDLRGARHERCPECGTEV